MPARILSIEQCQRISMVRQKIHELKLKNRCCEGKDGDRLVFFNNDEDCLFIADYYGNIVSRCNTRITPELEQLAFLEGKISRIAAET